MVVPGYLGQSHEQLAANQEEYSATIRVFSQTSKMLSDKKKV